MFDSATRRIVVSESATPDFQVLRLKAEDVDKNPTIIYSLKTEEGLPSSSFAVDSSTGEITVTEEGVDRERQSLYELICKCGFQIFWHGCKFPLILKK